MPELVDREGVFKFEVVESAIGVTQKNSYPQWIGRLKTVEKYVEDAEEMKHYKLEAPAYVSYEDQEIIAYLVLFNSADTFSVEGKERTAMLNYDQLKLALGWDGTEFDSLADGSHVGKKIQGRVQNDEYNGKVSLKVQWIDNVDAPPTRTLKSLDAGAVSALSKKLQISAKKPVVAAKPVTPPKLAAAPKPSASAPAASGPSTAAAPAAASEATKTPAPAQTVPSTSPTTTSPSSPAPKAKKTKAPPPPVVEKSDRPKASTKEEAWEFVNAHKGDNEDSVVEESWISACGEVLGDRNEDVATPEDWAKVRDTALKDLAV